ncbi:hypothetical protein Pcaca04_38390 [Pectobacterium carotovorum subsp. carotovorum]|nr:hypothetical protein Pcaca04_38390 [Pectobacterium carotovorum subsp. carotovorum]
MAFTVLYMQPVFCGRARRYEKSFTDGAESRRGIVNNALPTAQVYSSAQGCLIDHKKSNTLNNSSCVTKR